MSFWVYILRNTLNQLYIGQTNNLHEREKQHILKGTKTAKFIRNNDEFHLVYSEQYQIRLESMFRK